MVEYLDGHMSLLNEYINSGLIQENLIKESLNLIGKYNEYKGKFLFAYASAINKRIPDIILQQEDYFTITDLLRNKKLEKMDFYIETPGCSAETAEDIVSCLRKRCSLKQQGYN